MYSKKVWKLTCFYDIWTYQTVMIVLCVFHIGYWVFEVAGETSVLQHCKVNHCRMFRSFLMTVDQDNTMFINVSVYIWVSWRYRPFYFNLFVFRFNIVGYGCMTCIGNSGPLPEAVGKAIEQVRGLFCKFIHVIKQWQSRTCRSYYICKFDNDTALILHYW